LVGIQHLLITLTRNTTKKLTLFLLTFRSQTFIRWRSLIETETSTKIKLVFWLCF